MNNFDAVFSPADKSFPAKLGIRIDNSALCRVDYLSRGAKERIPANIQVSDIIEQFQQYFSDPAMTFEIPLYINDTRHRKQVWQQLRNICTGSVRTYGDIAQHLHSSARAVGAACRANPLSLVIPCHRVVAKDGIGGFSGQTSGRKLDIKRWLLTHEGYHC